MGRTGYRSDRRCQRLIHPNRLPGGLENSREKEIEMTYQAFRPGSPKRNTFAEAFRDAFNTQAAEQNVASIYVKLKAEGYSHEDAKNLTAIQVGSDETDYICEAIERDRLDRFNACTIIEYDGGSNEPKIVNK